MFFHPQLQDKFAPNYLVTLRGSEGPTISQNCQAIAVIYFIVLALTAHVDHCFNAMHGNIMPQFCVLSRVLLTVTNIFLLLSRAVLTATATAVMVDPIVVNTWPFTAATNAGYLALTASSDVDPVDAVVAGCSRAEEMQCDHTVGWGGSPDSNGESTLDAFVMSGIDQDTGAVANLRNIRDAIQVARDVLRLTKHSLLAGSLATDFAVHQGYKYEDLTSDYSRKLHLGWLQKGCTPNFWINSSDVVCSRAAPTSHATNPRRLVDEKNHDTIGQIALQADGRMAVGLSSNGARHKMAGRVGDAPLAGAGGYVDNDVGACVATGDGDVMQRYCPAFLGVELMRNGMTPQQAADAAIIRIARKCSIFSGAVVCVDKYGRHAAACQGFQKFSYSVQSTGSTETDVEIIEIQPISPPTKEQQTLMEAHWGVA